MLTIPGIASEYGKNCIAGERHVGVSACSLGSRVFTLITPWGYRGERFQESCGLGSRRDVMSHFHETCSPCLVQLMLPRVVMVGGGFGGLAAARALRNTPVSVTLIDKRNYHIFRPMLYQVARGLPSGDEISGPLRSILLANLK